MGNNHFGGQADSELGQRHSAKFRPTPVGWRWKWMKMGCGFTTPPVVLWEENSSKIHPQHEAWNIQREFLYLGWWISVPKRCGWRYNGSERCFRCSRHDWHDWHDLIPSFRCWYFRPFQFTQCAQWLSGTKLEDFFVCFWVISFNFPHWQDSFHQFCLWFFRK